MKAALIRVALGDLTDERDELLARLDGCQDGDCPHHGDDVDRLNTVLWLLDGCDDGQVAS